jgi:hypothetical protein
MIMLGGVLRNARAQQIAVNPGNSLREEVLIGSDSFIAFKCSRPAAHPVSAHNQSQKRSRRSVDLLGCTSRH